jgi:hypothetical protein
MRAARFGRVKNTVRILWFTGCIYLVTFEPFVFEVVTVCSRRLFVFSLIIPVFAFESNSCRWGLWDFRTLENLL